MIKLVIHDQVNLEVNGLLPSELNLMRNKFSYYVPGHFTMAAFRTGNWNGKESLIDESGITFFYLAEQILDFIENELDYNLDRDVELIDNRESFFDVDVPLIDENFLIKETERKLREHQVSGINSVIDGRKGFLEFSTSSGKTFIALGISKAFDPYIGSIVTVPSETLAIQTYKDYEKSDLDCGLLTKKVKLKDREEFIKSHRHIIMTTKLFLNCLEFFDEGEYVYIADETHKIGDVLFNALRDTLRNCPVRIGLTGTMPKDKLKFNKLKCHMGGDILDVITPRELMDKNYAASISIRMIETRDPAMEHFSYDNEKWDWDTEEKYLGTNKDRIAAIADYLKTLDDRNTLVLCHPQLGLNLSEYFNGKMVVDDTSISTRREWFDEFDSNEKGVFLCASYATSGTGISLDRIHRLVMVDSGKNPTYIKQGIGRAMRLSDNNDVEVVDISAKTKYSERHKKERVKLYKKEKFDYNEENHFIHV